MNPVMKILYAVVDFVLINIVVSMHGGVTLHDLMWYSLCVGLGFGLRIAVLVKDNKYTHKTLMIHMAFTICWCFLVVLLWRTALHKTWMNQGGNSFEIFLFINSLFSVFIVTQFEYVFKFGFKNWSEAAARKILAKSVKEDEV